MNDKMELPVNKASIQAYQRYAYAEIAGMCDETVDIFEINNYINVKCKEINEINNEIDYYFEGEKNYWDIPYLDTKWLLLDRVKMPICGIIKDMIDDERYVIFDGADDYYISERNQNLSQRFHRHHDGMIYGYDDTNDTFSLVIYTNEVLSCCTVPQQSLYLALNSEYINPEGFIVGAKKKKVDLQFDASIVGQGIFKYLQSGKGKDGYVYGIETGVQLEKHIRLSDEQTLDARALRLFWEHKEIMLKRLQYMANHGMISSEIVNKYEKIVKETNVARALQTKYIVLKQKTILDKVADKIVGIVQEEQEILGKLF